MGSLHYGVHHELEAAADELIRESLAGVTSQTAKRDILTPWKMKDRLNREVYVKSGSPDAALREGNFHRSYNPAYPHLNSTRSGAHNSRVDSMSAHVAYEGDQTSWQRPASGSLGE